MKRQRPAVLGLCASAVIATAALTGVSQAPATGPNAAAGFPQAWTSYAGNQQHNAAFTVPASAPTPLAQGVSWKFAEAGALPLSGGPYDENVLGYLPASVKTTQMLGNAVGVTALAGRIYAESDMNTVYSLNAMTGAKIWQSPTINAAMGNPVIGDGLVFVGAGDTGFSFGSMLRYASGSPGVTRGMGFAAVYAFAQNTGRQVWKFDTKGDSPTVDPATGIVLQDSVVDYNKADGTSDLALFATDAHTGQVLWEMKLGRGPSPLAYKAAIAMVHDSVVYVGNPATGFLYALDEKTGHLRWSTDLGSYTWNGTPYHIQDRGGPTLYHGVLYEAAGAYVFALNPANGHILARYNAGGRYGIVNPVIVGGTMYLGNSYNWVQAIPLSRIYPAWASGPPA